MCSTSLSRRPLAILMTLVAMTAASMAQPASSAAGPAEGIDPSDPFANPFRMFEGTECNAGRCIFDPPSLAVGSALVGQMVEKGSFGTLAFYRKSDGGLVLEDSPLFLTDSYSDNASFPTKVLAYDERSGRWLIAYGLVFGSPGDAFSGFGLFISDTQDPSGPWDGRWYGPFISGSGIRHLRLTEWSQAVVLSLIVNDFADSEGIAAVHRGDLLTTPFPRHAVVEVPIADDDTNRLRAVTYDPVGPPRPDVPIHLLRVRDDEVPDPAGADPTADFVDVLTFDIDWEDPGAASLNLLATLPIAEIDTAVEPALQPNGTPSVVQQRWVDAPRYRSFGTHEAIATLLPVRAEAAVADRSALYWFELRRTDGGTWTLHQQGVWDGGGTASLVGGSLTFDPFGDLVVAGQKLGPADIPSVVYTGRTSADPLGTLPLAEITLVQGAGSHAQELAGPHANLTLDPLDGCSFWIGGQYFDADEDTRSRLAAFRFPSCIPFFADGFESGDTSAWPATIP